MTADAAAPPDGVEIAQSEAPSLPLWLPILAALLLGLALSLPRFLTVWQTGAFFDSDDAMRLVQVRGLLAGQGWFDMTIYRLDPPSGVFMHWSRVVDVPLAALIKIFALALPPELAERAARLAFPLALQALLYLGVARLARLLMGHAAVIPAILLALLSGIVFGQFQPGRIDHHAPQIVLLVFMVANAVAALDPKQSRCAAWAGLLAALSLSISIETLPFIFALAGLLVLFWVVGRNDMGRALLLFGLGLGLGLPLAFVATIGKAHWFDASCDAFSSAYLLPGLAGALVSGLLGLAATRFDRWPARAAAALAGGLAVAAVFAATKPVCLRDPFFGIDPLLRELWLDKVSEAMPLRRFFQREPYAAISFMAPVLLGLTAICTAAWRTSGIARRRWIFVAGITCVGAAMCFWMIRVIGFTAPLALLGGAWCIVEAGAALSRTRWAKLAAASLLLVLPFSSIGWALVFTEETRKDTGESAGACLTPASIAAMKELQPGLVAAPIDAGSYILALTRHDVLAAPYHRNNHGNRLMIDALMADPQSAAALLRANGVNYVALCPDLGETATLAARAPNGLAGALQAGQIPPFLQPILPSDAEPKSLYRVFKVNNE